MIRCVLACLVLLATTACGKSPGERAAEAAMAAATGHEVSVDRDGEQMTVHTDAGDLQVNGGTLPATFPKDVYLPADYRIESAMEMPTAMVVHLATPGQLAAVAGAASQQMQAQGWTSMMTMAQSAQASVVMYEKGERHATLTIAEDAGKGVHVGYQLVTTPKQ